MQFILENWYLVLAAVVSGGLLLWPSLRGGGGGGANAVSTAEAVRLINREKAIVIDVGDAAEFDAGHVAGARSLPLATIEASKEGAKGLPTNKAAALLLVCPSGARATKAAALLAKLGYQNVRVIAGGLKAWREANLPIEKKAA